MGVASPGGSWAPAHAEPSTGGGGDRAGRTEREEGSGLRRKMRLSSWANRPKPKKRRETLFVLFFFKFSKTIFQGVLNSSFEFFWKQTTHIEIQMQQHECTTMFLLYV
jgi:hypothetical protein